MTRSDLLGRSGIRALLGFLVIWGAAVAYIAARGGDWTFPIASLLIFGLALGSIIWFLTRKMGAPAVPVEQPAKQSIALLIYLAIYAVLLIGIWLGTIKHAIPPGPTQELAILAYKLLIHVGIPVGILLALGSKLTGMFDTGMDRRGFWPALIVLCGLMFALLAVVSPSLKQIGALNLGFAAGAAWVIGSWAWYSVEAGLCEEFLFRACLQSRLTAWLKSPTAAIVVTSILFGLGHWPGLYLRGGPGVDGWSTDPIQVAAYTTATLAPLSLAIGLLWARTRSLLLVVLVHGAIDALPNTAEFFGIWS
ncbi:MAG TPA: CPBP family intramembrane glutamic endopeptidase [Sphingomicrobium sp.]|nr:CPBP family intramembrane glutamic endopeptidase [Sphingomicrobium sp.]